MAASSKHTGWYKDPNNSRLDFYYEGTRVGHLTGTTFVFAASVGVTITDTGLTITAGGQTITAGDLTVAAAGAAFIATSGNVELGNPGAFATTQPQGAVVMGGTSLNGIAPAGAITTAGGVFASDTVVRKIIAAGTVSNVET